MYRQVTSNMQDLHRTWLLLARRCCWIPESEVRLVATVSVSDSRRRRPSNVAGVTYTQGSCMNHHCIGIESANTVLLLRTSLPYVGC